MRHGAILILALAGAGCGRGGAPVAGIEEVEFPADLPRPAFETAVITVGGHPVTAEVADTDERRRYGFMFQKHLADDRGMIFIYPTRRPLAIWMRNTRMELDLLYVDDDGRVSAVYRRMKPFHEPQHSRADPGYTTSTDCRFAVELAGGWLDRHGVGLGARVEIPAELKALRAEEPGLLPNLPNRFDGGRLR